MDHWIFRCLAIRFEIVYFDFVSHYIQNATKTPCYGFNFLSNFATVDATMNHTNILFCQNIYLAWMIRNKALPRGNNVLENSMLQEK